VLQRLGAKRIGGCGTMRNWEIEDFPVQEEGSTLKHFQKTFLVAEWGSVRDVFHTSSLDEASRLVDDIQGPAK
jgi:hypothetical protein